MKKVENHCPIPMNPWGIFCHPHHWVKFGLQSNFLPWISNSHWTIPHLNPLTFPLCHHMIVRVRKPL